MPLAHDLAGRIARRCAALADAETADLRAALVVARERLAEYENATAWDTTCLNCSRLLDRCYEAEMRAEQAGERLAAAEAENARLKKVPRVDEIYGIDPDWTGDLSTDEYMQRIRGTDKEQP
jgi:hypothetical protein